MSKIKLYHEGSDSKGTIYNVRQDRCGVIYDFEDQGPDGKTIIYKDCTSKSLAHVLAILKWGCWTILAD
jgi:hypothetical protein